MATNEKTNIKKEPNERANLIKALENNLKTVAESQMDTNSEEEKENEDQFDRNEDEEMHDETEKNDDEDYEEEAASRVKKEPKTSKIIKQSQLAAALAAQQPSYIMKLFDRSVNLAQFEEDVPLYPLCRAWMKNHPRAFPTRLEKDNDHLNIQHAEEGDVVEMPKVRIRKGKTPARSEVRINKKDFDKQIDAEIWTKKKLLDEHRIHWQSERLRHIQAAQAFEEKHFAANLELLESLIK